MTFTDPDFVPHFTAAYGLFRRGDTFLFMRRTNTHYMDGYYGIPAGKAMEGEPITQTFLREMKEETGLDIKLDDARLCHVTHRYEPNQSQYAHWIDFYYLIEEWEGEPIITEPDKSDDLRWLTVDSDEKIIPYLRHIIKNVQENKIFSLSGDWLESQQAA